MKWSAHAVILFNKYEIMLYGFVSCTLNDQFTVMEIVSEI